MKAMAMVAHPDDCVIFAYSFIHHHPEYQWTICYLTYSDTDSRGREFKEFWNRRKIKTKFLQYDDAWNQQDNCPGQIDEASASNDIQSIIADQDLVLTHNHYGEYGHPHHILVNRATSIHPRRVTFAGPGQGSIKYSLLSGTYDLDELPLHKDIIKGFHLHSHSNEYFI